MSEQRTNPETTAGEYFHELPVDERIAMLRGVLAGINDQRRRVAESISILETWQAEQCSAGGAE